jgi:hypothetical protein
VCCVLCAVCCVLCAVCCVLCVVCCVLCAVCCVLCVVCCVLCVVCCVLCAVRCVLYTICCLFCFMFYTYVYKKGLVYGYTMTISDHSFPANKYLCGINNDFQTQSDETLYVWCYLECFPVIVSVVSLGTMSILSYLGYV